MVIGFVNSGMMKLKQAIGIIMGAISVPVSPDGSYVFPILKDRMVLQRFYLLQR